MTLDKLEIFCVTDKKIPHIEKTNYKIAAVGKDNFPDSYLRCDTKRVEIINKKTFNFI